MAKDPFADDYTPDTDDVPFDTEETDETVTDAFDTDENDAPAYDGFGVSLTFKGDGAYYSPWIVLRAPNAAGLRDLLDDDLKELIKESTTIAKGHYKLAQEIAGEKPARSGGGGNGGGGGGNYNRAPQAAKEHPDGKKEFCEHGEMDYKTGVTKSGKNQGKAWHAFDCSKGVCDRKWDNG
jgi:hypothetical protein